MQVMWLPSAGLFMQVVLPHIEPWAALHAAGIPFSEATIAASCAPSLAPRRSSNKTLSAATITGVIKDVGVRQVGDQPISKVVFWSIRTTVCPEAYNHFQIEPGHEAKWRVAYDFYELAK